MSKQTSAGQMPPRERYQDKITVRVAHDKSLYIVYQGNVPPIDGQEYLSLTEHTSALAEKDARIAELERIFARAKENGLPPEIAYASYHAKQHSKAKYEAELTRLREALERAEEAFSEYGSHDDGCASWDCERPAECTCGYSAAFAEIVKAIRAAKQGEGKT
jgi:hypothetical protein